MTDSVDAAVEEILQFFRVYHSMRYVKNKLVFRLHEPISDELLADINENFRDILVDGQFTQGEPAARRKRRTRPDRPAAPDLPLQPPQPRPPAPTHRHHQPRQRHPTPRLAAGPTAHSVPLIAQREGAMGWRSV